MSLLDSSRSAKVLHVALVFCVFVVVVAMVSAAFYVRHANHTRKNEQIAACMRGNQVRERVNIHDQELGLDNPGLPILDCPHVIH